MQSRRHLRVRELLKREIGEVLRREIPISEAGIITVNEVGVSGDLHSATVFVGIIGNPDQKKKALDVLLKHKGRIQSEVGRAVILKYTPQLRFVVDESAERAQRVLQVIEELEKESPAE